MVKMRCCVSQTMVKVLRREISGLRFDLVRFDKETAKFFVGELIGNDIDRQGRVKTIRVIYPPEMYACDRYLTTKDLHECLKKSGKVFENFIKEVADFVAI